MSGSPQFRWSSSSRTDVGKVRKVNEDALLDRSDVGLWVVADGMGGHAAGDVASRMVVENLRSLPAPDTLGAFVDAVEARLLDTNARLRDIAVQTEKQTIGSTVAVLLLFRGYAVCLWAGDSRIYRLRGHVLERLTQDHALVEDLVEQGMLTRAEAEIHPQANLITRAVGATDDLFLDLDMYELADGDTFVLCSDGLSKEVSEAAIAEAITAATPQEISDALVEMALAKGAHDNTTVITVRVERLPSRQRETTVPPAGDDRTVPSQKAQRGGGNT